MSERTARRVQPPTLVHPLLGTALLHVFNLEADDSWEGVVLQIDNDVEYEGSPSFLVKWDFVEGTVALFIRDSSGTRKVDTWNTST